jgi:ribosome maturation factor RimP
MSAPPGATENATVVPFASQVDAAVRSVLEAQGFDLVLVEFVGASRILRLYIDTNDTTRAVGIEQCAQVSRLVGDLLDAKGLSDSIHGSYKLEVSSPGLDRPLTRPKDFCRFVGDEVRLTVRAEAAPAFEGRRRFRGRLENADPSGEGGIRVSVDGKTFEFGYGHIEQARLVPNF